VGCNEGDILISMSDGVHDNLDPQSIGVPPSDFGLKEETWDDVDIQVCTNIKTQYMNDLITKIITTERDESSSGGGLGITGSASAKRAITPALITKRLVRHCLEMTKNSREWMEQNPQGILESNYQKFPGKLDHTTCVACVVGPYDPSQNDDKPTAKSLRPEVWPF